MAKFITVTNDKGEKEFMFTPVNSSHYTWSRHADWNSTQVQTYKGEPKSGEITTDRDLLKLWSHATIEKKFGQYYASKPVLKKVLESRGYRLSENGHRWFKTETV